MKPARICNVPTCPEIVENSNGKCSKHHRLAKKAADKRTGRVRGSRWTQLRRTVLTARPFCACRDCESPSHVVIPSVDRKTRCREPATEVDHVIPLSHGGHPTALSNLQGLCHVCHENKTRREYHGKVIE